MASLVTAPNSFLSGKKIESKDAIFISHSIAASRKVLAVMAPTQSRRAPSTTGSVKHAMTMTEKILARASERTSLEPGENVWVNVDVLMTHDVCGPGTIGIFKKEFGQNAKVWDREKVVIIPDHYIFTSDERANRNVDILRDFCMEQNIKYFYDIKDLGNFKANPDYKGVCHIALAQEGHCRPGEVLLGTDSHTCNAGAFGEFATGIGNTDAGFVMGTGKLLLKVPPTLRFIMDGEMPNYLLAKDLILQIIGEISVSGATYKSMEFVGSTIESLTMEERMTLCNMVVEAGGKNGVIPADETTFKYLQGKTSMDFEPVYSDGHAREEVKEIQSRSLQTSKVPDFKDAPSRITKKTASSYREVESRKKRVQQLEKLYSDMALQKELQKSGTKRKLREDEMVNPTTKPVYKWRAERKR